MLEGLDSIPWGKLRHAYGRASDVPGDLRALRSDQPGIREGALDRLYGTIFHQGKRYEATPYAVPFLCELIDALTLARCGVSARARIVPALCETLQGVNVYQSLDITRAILDLLSAGRAKLVGELPAGELDATERAALQAIADFGGWSSDGMGFLNYRLLVEAYGLPDTREGLQQYLTADALGGV
jgi:hypothetical protein